MSKEQQHFVVLQILQKVLYGENLSVTMVLFKK